MPPVVTTVRESGDRSGSFLTVCRDPQAKNPDPIKPTTNPVPTDRLWTITPLASTPPKSTRITAKRNRIVNYLLSKITSKPMAVIGIAATARAAVVASDIDGATSNMTEPNPNPKSRSETQPAKADLKGLFCVLKVVKRLIKRQIPRYFARKSAQGRLNFPKGFGPLGNQRQRKSWPRHKTYSRSCEMF